MIGSFIAVAVAESAIEAINNMNYVRDLEKRIKVAKQATLRNITEAKRKGK